MWLVVLAFGLWADQTGGEGGLLFLLVVVVDVAAAPISLVAIGILSVVEKMVPMGVLTGIHPSFREFFLIWCSIMFALSYWQWFYLIPKIIAAFKQRSELGSE
jgi:hypothetical protein